MYVNNKTTKEPIIVLTGSSRALGQPLGDKEGSRGRAVERTSGAEVVIANKAVSIRKDSFVTGLRCQNMDAKVF